MTQIEAYNYTIGLDTRRLKSGGIVTRRELAQLRRDFKSLQNPTDKARLQLERLTRAYKAGAVTSADYREAVKRIREGMPEAIAERKRLADAERDAAQIRQGLITESQMMAAEFKRVSRAVRDGGLTTKEATEHLRKYKSQLPSARAEAKRLAEVERERMAMMDRGKALQRQYMTATERHTAEIKEQREELERLKKAGAIDTKTHARAKLDLDRREREGLAGTKRKGLLGRASELPGVGGAADKLGGLAAMGAPLAGLAVTVGAVVVAYKAASAAVSVFTAKTLEQGQVIADTNRSAKLLGTSVSELQAFQFAAADTANLSADQSLTIATKLSAKLSEAAAGGGEALASIKELGLEPIELATQDPALAMRNIVQAASEIENPVDRARIATKLFEEEGIALAGVLAKGSKGLDDARNKAERFGLIVSDIDAEGISIAESAIADVRSQFDGFFRQASVEFAPIVTALARSFSDWLPPIQQTEPLIDAAAAGLVEVLAVTANVIQHTKRLAAVYIDLKTFDLKGLRESLPALTKAATAGDVIRKNYADAKREAAQLAEQRKAEADASRKQAIEDKRQQQITTVLVGLHDQLKPDDSSLEAQRTELKGLQANADQLRELKDLHDRIADAKREAANVATLAKAKEELALTRETLAMRTRLAAAGIDDKSTAKELAKLKLAGATNAQLNDHLRIKKQLLAFDQQGKAHEEQKRQFEQLKSEAESVRESLRSPVEGLAADFDKLGQFYRAGLLTAREYTRAKIEATKALVQVPNNLTSKSLGVRGAYDAIVEQQNERRKAQLQASATRRLINAANQVAQHERKRVKINEEITQHMKKQAVLADSIRGGSQPGGAVTSEGGGSSRVFERIAEATEETARTISEWELESV